MNTEIYAQITIGLFTIISGVVSALLTNYLNQKSERNKRRLHRISELKSWVSNLSIFGFMQSVEYYEIRNLMNNQEKEPLDNQINIVNSKYKELHTALDLARKIAFLGRGSRWVYTMYFLDGKKASESC